MERISSIKERNINEYGKLKKMKIFSTIDKNYLEKTYKDMAMKGWLVDTVKGFRDVYKPIEPCELEFSVTFFQLVTAFDYPDTDKEDTYQEFCEDSGWTLAAKNDQYFVYYKTLDSKALPIYTESSEEYQSIWDIVKKNELINFSIQILSMMLLLWTSIKTFSYESFYTPGGLFTIIFPILFLIFLGSYMMPTILWLIKNRSRAKENELLICDSYSKVRSKNRRLIGEFALILIFFTYNTISLSSYFNIKFLLIYLLNVLIIMGIGILLSCNKIKKIKSKRSTNIIIVIVISLITVVMIVCIAVGLMCCMHYEMPNENIPNEIPILTHKNLGSDLEFQPKSINTYKTFMVPISFEYKSYHKNHEEDFYDIELKYIQARTDWMANIIANRAIYDELQRVEKNKMDLMLDGISIDYVHSLNPDLYGLDMAYNLSEFNTQVILVKNNIIYFVHLDKAIDNEILEKIIPILFEKTNNDFA